ncbi:hypothetical protein, partial [Vibrio anguillarum]|uniref:hypothetical protein n=1 Tax=Vibrio anguillarum TaxID=55601 RepID=UPI001BE4794B
DSRHPAITHDFPSSTNHQTCHCPHYAVLPFPVLRCYWSPIHFRISGGAVDWVIGSDCRAQ